jgi:hypothetical protein
MAFLSNLFAAFADLPQILDQACDLLFGQDVTQVGIRTDLLTASPPSLMALNSSSSGVSPILFASV